MVSLEDAVIARLESHGERFEILVDPDLAAEFRKDESGADIEDILAVQEVFKDARKGDKASEETMRKLFQTDDPLEVAKIILKKGSIQLTAEQRRQMIKEKYKKIVNKIAREAINPQTGLPHPPKRIEKAMKEAKVHVDPFKTVDEQVNIVLKAIRTKIPIKFEKVKVAIKIPGETAGPVYGIISNFGKIIEEEWQKDGSWIAIVEIPGGLQDSFYQKMSEMTGGQVETKLLK
ncbi:MAG TPA: ribosome assembly factor SBDS [Methanothermobacter sp.]|jgi:ribosome maturation protein SDO1|uniref:RNA-associated protein n=1 Tax=Methanothermobacter tenebrarum TaxID=680118 RepID=A0ABM7YED0_9EURY|nr:ribosome assembly factor SBDS [Methanothermobacter tenebrarum]MDI6881382.1 ribosome assembly factor SBDS [Methanothermobacter sp.]MDX9693302.1 ribosome assembly factor SBDS [Methanothermobacter sp.]BDH79656.1 RNA-associated protein [Methanothermobacter tenebrarum]HHW16284.1 ribosome assembly factor SBDS [Methanothermobacter sp.]HOQ20222.1 ribosome assembly factor SBDS [Methanothermobacter sp.]